jgi:hypothetical protein
MRVKELIEKLSVISPDALVVISGNKTHPVTDNDDVYIHLVKPGHKLTVIEVTDPCLDCQRLHGKLNHCTKTCKVYSDFVPMKGKE